MNNFLYDLDSQTINLIVKLPGQNCNIDCDYCFEIKKKGINKKIITPNELEKLIKEQSKKVTITLHGGEPLLIGYSKMDAMLAMISNYYPKIVTTIRLQTNATLLNEQWAELLFKKYHHLDIGIAVSLDGNDYQNRLRIDKKGVETYNRVQLSLSLLSRYKIRFGILSVINRKTLTQPFEFLQSLVHLEGLKFIKLIPLFNMEAGYLTADSIKPTEFATFIEDISQIYISKGYFNRLPIEPLLSIIQKINKQESRYCNFQESKCYNFITVYPKGKFSPCDCFSLEDLEIHKNENRSLENSIKLSINNSAVTKLMPLIEECNNCKIRNFCTGGCLANRYYLSESNELNSDYCESRKQLYRLAEQFKFYEKTNP